MGCEGTIGGVHDGVGSEGGPRPWPESIIITSRNEIVMGIPTAVPKPTPTRTVDKATVHIFFSLQGAEKSVTKVTKSDDSECLPERPYILLPVTSRTFFASQLRIDVRTVRLRNSHGTLVLRF